MAGHLIIGGDGLVGSALRREMLRRKVPWVATSRRAGSPPGVFLDLLNFDEFDLAVQGSHVYLVAAVSGFRACEADPGSSWRVNVDAPIFLADYYRQRSAKIVFISSEAVESCGGTALGRQKAAAEAYMRTAGVVIIRPTKITPGRVDSFASFVVDAAYGKPGLRRWE